MVHVTSFREELRPISIGCMGSLGDEPGRACQCCGCWQLIRRRARIRSGWDLFVIIEIETCQMKHRQQRGLQASAFSLLQCSSVY